MTTATPAAAPVTADLLLEPGPVRPTRRLPVLGILGVILWGAGSNVGAAFLVILAGGLLVSIPWGWWSASRGARTVHARRELPQRVVAGSPAEVALHVRASAIGTLVVHDELTAAVGVVDDPRNGGVLRTEARLGRGLAGAGTVTVEVADAFGLFRAVASGRVPGRVESLPAIVPMAAPDLVASARRTTDQRSRRHGAGSETDGTREYRHGDSPRAVHWRSSARREQLIVRQFVGDTAGRIGIRVETGPWSRDRLDQACVLAASLADACQRAGGQVEVNLGVATVAWGPVARRALASLTPNLATDHGRGGPSIELASATASGPPPSVIVALRANGAGAEATVEADGTTRSLGAFPDPMVADDEALVDWFVEQVR